MDIKTYMILMYDMATVVYYIVVTFLNVFLLLVFIAAMSWSQNKICFYCLQHMYMYLYLSEV